MKTRILLPALALLLVLSSCSNMRFGHVPKVKAKKQETVAQKPAKKHKVAQLPALEGKEEGLQAVEPDYSIQQPVVASPMTVSPEKTTTVTTEQAPLKSDNTATTLSPKIQKKIKKIESLTATKKVEKGSWLWFVIVGIVLVLLGVIIPWVLGWLFYVIGVICIIYGLLMFLGIF